MSVGTRATHCERVVSHFSSLIQFLAESLNWSELSQASEDSDFFKKINASLG
jgi:hypothetical protein